MKITLFTLFILVAATTAFGQVGASISSEAHMTVIPDHPQHAELHALADEHALVGGGGYSYAQGERPLWEFGSSVPAPAPLGDIARAVRKEKLAVKKAEIVFEKQGS
ncbi:MAG TPA: hypothetical protein VFL34_07345 [Candidatus Sulfotelmatobacter sp.]|nr:hypothetical protein [Candidatus Sulfotelmatobacter sp.]